MIVGLGGLFFEHGPGPLLSAFVPPLVRDALGDHRTAIGTVMAIDNVLLLLLVPWAGAVSDRAVARGRGRLALVLSGLVLASAGMVFLPSSVRFGITGLVGAIVLLYSGINLLRSPFQALIADLVPSRYRSLATGSVMFQMCVGAVVFLMLTGCSACGRHFSSPRARSSPFGGLSSDFANPARRSRLPRRRFDRSPLRRGRRREARCRACAPSSSQPSSCS